MVRDGYTVTVSSVGSSSRTVSHLAESREQFGAISEQSPIPRSGRCGMHRS
jgi:hypothetical protein